MLHSKKTKIGISPWSMVLLALFLIFASPDALGAVLLAALCHELGHWLVAGLCGAGVEELYVSPFGVRMRLPQRPTLSYGREFLVVVAGPAVNVVLALLFARCGIYGSLFYTLAGAQLVLGAFNLLPIRPMDGGRMLWLAMAWGTESITADRLMGWIEFAAFILLFLLSVWIWRETGSPFLSLASLGMGKSLWQEKKLVIERKRR